jgi:hypothetical protein
MVRSVRRRGYLPRLGSRQDGAGAAERPEDRVILAIDPGNERSAAVVLNDAGSPVEFWKEPNDEVLRRVLAIQHLWPSDERGEIVGHLAIEMIASYGMPVGREVFDTCVWIGRFVQAWNAPHTLVYRRDVKMFLCGNNTAKDGNIRQALIDRFGGKDRAIGNKRAPGPLHGISNDVWSALAVGVTWRETRAKAAA